MITNTHDYVETPIYIRKSKQGNTTNLNIFFSMENEKRAAQVRLEPMTHWLAI